MSKYKINRNKPTPSDEQIRKHQDFGRLYRDYEKIYDGKAPLRFMRGDKKLLSIVLVILIVILTMFLVDRDHKTAEKEKNSKADKDSLELIDNP